MRRFTTGLIVGCLITAAGLAIGGDQRKDEAKEPNIGDRVEQLETGLQTCMFAIVANSQRIAALEKTVSCRHPGENPFPLMPKRGFWPVDPSPDPPAWPDDKGPNKSF